jgi:hypothetical protein
MHVLDLSRAWDPSHTEAYKLVLAALSFRGGTKKSHSEQQLPAALMGRSNKEGSATGKGAALYYVEPPTMALHLCFNERWDRSCHFCGRVAILTKSSHT